MLPDTKKIEEAYAKLSNEEFEVLNSIGIDEKCAHIGMLMRLTKDQVDATSLYTTFTILGLYSEKELHDAVASEGLSQLQLTEVYSQVIDLIINPYLDKIADLKAQEESPEALEQADTGIEIIEPSHPMETPSVVIRADTDKGEAEAKVFAQDDIVIEQEAPLRSESSAGQTENRDEILEDLEHPPTSEPVIFNKVPITVVQTPPPNIIPINLTPTLSNDMERGKNSEPPHDLPIEEVAKEDTVAKIVPQPIPVEQTEQKQPADIATITKTFAEIPKVAIIDVDHTAPVADASQKNPLGDTQALHNAQEHLRELARARYQSFVAQKMTAPFALPKKETTVTAASQTTPPTAISSKDPYHEQV